MARLATCGFERPVSDTTWRSAESCSINSGGAFQSVGPGGRTGSCLTVATTAQVSNMLFGPNGATGATGTSYFLRFYLRFPAPPSAAAWVGTLQLQAGANGAIARLNTDRTMNLLNSGGSVVGAASAPLALDTWHRIELRMKINASTSDDECELRVNGVFVAQQLNVNTATSIGANYPQGMIGISNAVTATVMYDDLALNDDTGTDQNSWPGDGKVAYLKPISDNAVGVGWTNDAGGTTNLFDALDNNPPAGIADTVASTGLHQIRNADTNSNRAVDVNMESYTTGGIGAADTITLVCAVANTGAPVTTGAKAGTLGIVSNPVQTPAALGGLGTAGAFWSGTAAGSFATGWKHSFGPVTYNPAVTKGSSPVVRINQVTGASTRIAMCCNLGLLVEYVSASSTNPVSVAGAVTPVGDLSLVVVHSVPVVGSVGPVGVQARQVAHAVGGAIPTAGAVARTATYQRALGGTLWFTRTVGRALTMTRGGALALTGDALVLRQGATLPLAVVGQVALAGEVQIGHAAPVIDTVRGGVRAGVALAPGASATVKRQRGVRVG